MFAVPKPALSLSALLMLVHLGAVACGSDAANKTLLTERVAGKFEYTAQLCNDAGAKPVEAQPHYAQQLSLYDTKPAVRIRYVTPAIRSSYGAGSSNGAASSYGVYGTGMNGTPSASIGMGIATPNPATGPIADAFPEAKVSGDAATRAIELSPQVAEVARAYRIDPLLLHAIAHIESRHNPKAISHAGAIGMMQVMPATARRFGVAAPHSQLRDPKTSLEVSSAYLKFLQERFDNDLTLVIAAYNAGEGAVEKHGRRVPPYKETQAYVRDVLKHYRMLVDVRAKTRGGTAVAQGD